MLERLLKVSEKGNRQDAWAVDGHHAGRNNPRDTCLSDRLLSEVEQGIRWFKDGFPFNLYHEPSLNPSLHGKQQGSK